MRQDAHVQTTFTSSGSSSCTWTLMYVGSQQQKVVGNCSCFTRCSHRGRWSCGDGGYDAQRSARPRVWSRTTVRWLALLIVCSSGTESSSHGGCTQGKCDSRLSCLSLSWFLQCGSILPESCIGV